MSKEGFPVILIEADNIPQAHFRATKEVLERGLERRTQYDRKEGDQFIDPAGRDANVFIKVKNPFNQPRYPRISHCEIGKYFAEIMGAKDHLVIPYERLLSEVGSDHQSTEWPYSYHQRLFSYPLHGRIINQIDLALDRLAADNLSRRAVSITGQPEVDAFMKEDIPCLREVQLRTTEDEGIIYLHMSTTWRSRDLFQAWPDNVLALTFMQGILAQNLSSKIDKPVQVGSYTDYSTSLHLYGQTINEKGVRKYVSDGEEKAVMGARTSQFALDNLVIPQLQELLTEDQWNFPQSSKRLISDLIEGITSGRYLC